MATPHSRSPSLDPDGDSFISDATTTKSSSLVQPIGPVCSYGPRLAYTYFAHPIPRAETLNAAQQDVHFFTVDDQLLYLSFFQDSGPLNAACLYRFCLHVHTLLEDEAHRQKRVFLYSSDEPDKKANAALLISLYAMIVMRWHPADVLHPIACLELQPFRDAGYARADFHLSVQSVIYGTYRAIALRLLDLSTFDLVAYETYEKVENGDWNWITPGFVAFASPVEPSYVAAMNGAGNGQRRVEGAKPRLSKAFSNVLQEFERGGVKVVVRLNKKLYDASHFTSRGMKHVEMYFDDGTNPTMEMTREFIDLADEIISAGGAVAVHCKAGLGRTGTLIGAYLIYKHGFTAAEAIGFMRLMRPGSCVGPQQHFLYENQMTWVRWAAVDAYKAEQAALAPAPVATSTTPNAVASTSALPVNEPPVTPPTQRIRRSITPPNESELARTRPTTPGPAVVVPRTPGRNAPVPGQPRKTPGKSKHSVATPEVQHADELDLPPKNSQMLIEESGEGDDDEEDEDETEDLTSAMKAIPALELVPKASTSAAVGGPKRSATPSSNRPTRIARPRTRPLSAITDHRIVDRLGLTTGPAGAAGRAREGASSTIGAATGRALNGAAAARATTAEEARRSKTVRELGTLFEQPSVSASGDGTSSGPGSAASGSSRYRTRGTRATTPSMDDPVPSLAEPPASPTKLPQRVPAKRRGQNKEKASASVLRGSEQVDAGATTAPRRERSVTTSGVAGMSVDASETSQDEKVVEDRKALAASVGLSSRSVRRRRSSLGDTDFVQS